MPTFTWFSGRLLSAAWMSGTMTRLSRSAWAGSMRAVERGALAGAPAVGLGVPDDGDGLETGAAQAAASEPAARRATSEVFMAGYPLVLTVRLLTTALTPLTLQAMFDARCLRSSLGTVPLSVTVRRLVSTSTLVRVDTFSAASLAFTWAVMVASSMFSPALRLGPEEQAARLSMVSTAMNNSISDLGRCMAISQSPCVPCACLVRVKRDPLLPPAGK